MFYVAEALLLGRGLSFSKHSAVIAAFGREFSKTGIVAPHFHKHLIEGEDARTAGDYEAEAGIGEPGAREQIAHAEEFLKLGERLLRVGER